MDTTIIFDFKNTENIQDWRIVNDTVMGGRSQSEIELSEEGYGSFSGKVSLENNGGFASVRYRGRSIEVGTATKIKLRVKGDDKKYQCRIKDSLENEHSHICYFKTNGQWQDIELRLDEMYPSYRGRDLELPNFSAGKIEDFAFLIANKEEEEFELIIDKILLI